MFDDKCKEVQFILNCWGFPKEIAFRIVKLAKRIHGNERCEEFTIGRWTSHYDCAWCESLTYDSYKRHGTLVGGVSYIDGPDASDFW